MSAKRRNVWSQGTTIVTHESNKQYYLDILFDVLQHAPAHGRVGTQEEFMRIVTAK